MVATRAPWTNMELAKSNCFDNVESNGNPMSTKTRVFGMLGAVLPPPRRVTLTAMVQEGLA